MSECPAGFAKTSPELLIAGINDFFSDIIVIKKFYMKEKSQQFYLCPKLIYMLHKTI